MVAIGLYMTVMVRLGTDYEKHLSEKGQLYRSVRRAITSEDFDDWPGLVKKGSSLFPVFRQLLNDPDLQEEELSGILLMLRAIKGNRNQFLGDAVRALVHKDEGVRHQAAMLVGQIGGPREAAPLVALISDPDLGVVTAAAGALATVGGDRELLAFDIWLRSNWKRDEYIRRAVQKSRDELKQRLDKAAAGRK